MYPYGYDPATGTDLDVGTDLDDLSGTGVAVEWGHLETNDGPERRPERAKRAPAPQPPALTEETTPGADGAKNKPKAQDAWVAMDGHPISRWFPHPLDVLADAHLPVDKDDDADVEIGDLKHPEMVGWMHKYTGSLSAKRAWKRRYFVLKGKAASPPDNIRAKGGKGGASKEGQAKVGQAKRGASKSEQSKLTLAPTEPCLLLSFFFRFLLSRCQRPTCTSLQRQRPRRSGASSSSASTWRRPRPSCFAPPRSSSGRGQAKYADSWQKGRPAGPRGPPPPTPTPTTGRPMSLANAQHAPAPVAYQHQQYPAPRCSYIIRDCILSSCTTLSPSRRRTPSCGWSGCTARRLRRRTCLHARGSHAYVPCVVCASWRSLWH